MGYVAYTLRSHHNQFILLIFIRLLIFSPFTAGFLIFFLSLSLVSLVLKLLSSKSPKSICASLYLSFVVVVVDGLKNFCAKEEKNKQTKSPFLHWIVGLKRQKIARKTNLETRIICNETENYKIGKVNSVKNAMKNCGHCVTSVVNIKKTKKIIRKQKCSSKETKTRQEKKTIIELSLSAAAAVAITTRKVEKL